MMDVKPTRLPTNATQEEIPASLPVQARVRPARWVILWVVLVVVVVGLTWMIFWPPGDVSPGFWMYRGLSFIALPVCLAVFPWAAMGLFRPRHATFDETRVWTRDWSVDWADVQRVRAMAPTREHTLKVVLTQPALAPSAMTRMFVFDELKRRNRRVGSPR